MKHIRTILPPPPIPAHLLATPGVKVKTLEAQANRRRIKKQKLQRQGGRCPYCTQPISVRQATVEHKKPIARGGVDAAHNIDAACQSCNTAKGSLTKREFLLAIFNPNLRRDGWKVYLACIEIRLKRRTEAACTRLRKIIEARPSA